MDGKAFKDDYLKYIQKFLSIRNLKSSSEINLPLFDRHGDQITVYIQKNSDGYLISDDGYAINDLLDSGLTLTAKRKESIQSLCQMNGIEWHENELTIQTTKSKLVNSVHSFGQALLQIVDMYMTSQSRVQSFFYEDVQKLLDENKIHYLKSMEVKGRSGLSQGIDFSFQSSETKPERLCITVNHATKEKAMSSAFIWEDIKDNRDPGTQFIVIVNDENPVFSDFTEVLKEYGADSVMYSQMSKKLDMFN